MTEVRIFRDGHAGAQWRIAPPRREPDDARHVRAVFRAVMILFDARFEVDAEGRAEALRTQRRLPHAWVAGRWADAPRSTEDSCALARIESWRYVSYKPSGPAAFVDVDGNEVHEAPIARFDRDGLLWIPDSVPHRIALP